MKCTNAELGRIGRLLYLTDDEFESVNQLLATFRKMAPGQILKLARLVHWLANSGTDFGPKILDEGLADAIRKAQEMDL